MSEWRITGNVGVLDGKKTNCLSLYLCKWLCV